MSNENEYGGKISDKNNGASYSFGLNQRVKLVDFGYSNTIKMGEKEVEGVVFSLEFEEGGKYNTTIFLPSSKDAKGDELDKDAFQKIKTQFRQKIYHIGRCFASESDLNSSVAIPLKSAKDFVNAIMSCWREDWKDIELDVFFQYQWQLKGDNEKKFLEIAKDTKQGMWLYPTEEGTFSKVLIAANGDATVDGQVIGKVSGKELKLENGDVVKLPAKDLGLIYLDLTTNALHYFNRSTWFMLNGWGTAEDSSASDTLESWS